MPKKSAISKVLAVWAICQILVLFLVCKEALDNAGWVIIWGLTLVYMFLWVMYYYIMQEINNKIIESQERSDSLINELNERLKILKERYMNEGQNVH